MSANVTDVFEVDRGEYELLLESAVNAGLRRHTLVGFVSRIVTNRASMLSPECRKRVASAIIDFPGPTSPEDEVVWRHALKSLERAAHDG